MNGDCSLKRITIFLNSQEPLTYVKEKHIREREIQFSLCVCLPGAVQDAGCCWPSLALFPVKHAHPFQHYSLGASVTYFLLHLLHTDVALETNF